MARVEIRIPQIGEGLTEACVIALLKRKGDRIDRDEPLFEIETDKATLVIESRVSGRIAKWRAEEGAVLPIGSVIALIESDAAEAAATMEPDRDPPVAGSAAGGTAVGRRPPIPADPTSGIRGEAFSPRVRAYCRESRISLEEMRRIPRSSPAAPLRVSDVEHWLRSRGAPAYADRPLSPREQMMAQRLTQAWYSVVPASIEMEFDWDRVREARTLMRRRTDGKLRPSSLELIAWCVVRAIEVHPRFRTILVGENTVREYADAQLGVAVGLPGDELATAAVADAGRHDFPAFVGALREGIERVRRGEAAGNVMHIVISNLAPYGVRSAQPVVVPPSVATLFVGAPYPVPVPSPSGSIQWQRNGRLVLAFDHRLIHGVGAARFLRDVHTGIQKLPESLPV